MKTLTRPSRNQEGRPFRLSAFHPSDRRPTVLRGERVCRAFALAFLLVVSCGCPATDDSATTPTPVASTALDSPLRLTVVDDPGLADAIEHQWQVRSGDKLVVERMALTDFIMEGRNPSHADAVIYPSRFLGELVAARRIVPVPKYILTDERWDRGDIFELLRLRETVWGKRVWAIPFGSPQLNLYYRADLLDRLERKPPSTWRELEQLQSLLDSRERLGDLAPPPGTPWHAVVQPLGPGWAGQVLLARASAYARHRGFYSALFDYRTMEPRIAQAPFVRALEELVRCASHGPGDAIQLTPSDVRRLFLQGQCALALAWPNHQRIKEASAGAQTPVAMGYSELPGASRVFNFRDQRWETRRDEDEPRVPFVGIAGRVGSVMRRSGQKRRAFNLLAWLSGKEWSTDIASHSHATTLFRRSHQSKPRRWADPEADDQTAIHYADLVAQIQSRKVCLVTVRIPGVTRYMAALDEAVQEAVSGRKPPQQALEDVADVWRQITNELGLETQRQAYQHSLGLN